MVSALARVKHLAMFGAADGPTLKTILPGVALDWRAIYGLARYPIAAELRRGQGLVYVGRNVLNSRDFSGVDLSRVSTAIYLGADTLNLAAHPGALGCHDIHRGSNFTI